MFNFSRQVLGALLIVFFSIFEVGRLQYSYLQQIISKQQTANVKNLEKQIQTEKLRLNLLQKMPSFGYANLIADWIYLNFLQYFGDDEARAQTGYSLSPEYFEVILARDPRFLQAYLGLSISTSMLKYCPKLLLLILLSIVIFPRAIASKPLLKSCPSPAIDMLLQKIHHLWKEKVLLLGLFLCSQKIFLPKNKKAYQYLYTAKRCDR